MTDNDFSLPDSGPYGALILGGARSGKSRFGEALVRNAKGRAVYVATAEKRDDEMQQRILQHQQDRGHDWHLIEEPINLARVLSHHVGTNDVVLVDCLTIWLCNLMEQKRDIEGEFDELLDALRLSPARIVLISNEVGWGIVPDNAMARAFRDHAGRLHQRLAAQIDTVIAVIAGLPLTLKAPPQRR